MSLGLVACGGGSSSTPPAATPPNIAVLSLSSGKPYLMQSLPLQSGLITGHTSTAITYAIDTIGFVVLNGSFTYTGVNANNPNEVLANFLDPTGTNTVSGTVNEIIQLDLSKNVVLDITQLAINESTFENLLDNSSLFKIWQLITQSNGGLQVKYAGTTITCPNPSSGASAASITTTAANQNINSFFASSCTP